jgi:Na+/melibiose symporter-like transporter
MPCLLALLALIAPRVVSVVLWMFTTFFDRAFGSNLLLLVLGVALLPFTTLAYAWAVNAEGGVHSAFFLVVIVVALISDLSSWETGRRYRSYRTV